MIRVVNRLLVLVLGAALLVGGLLVIIEGAWNWTNSGFIGIPGSDWLSAFKSTPWSEPVSLVISGAVAAFGLLLLLLQIRPHPKRLISFETDTDADWKLVRRSAERRIQRRLVTQVPVKPIKAKITAKTARWQLTLKAGAAASSRPVLESAGKSELELLHAPKLSKVRARTTGATKAAS